MTHYDNSGATSSLFGFVTSAIGTTVLGYAGDLFTAFTLGIVGAFGGWLFHKIRKRFDK